MDMTAELYRRMSETELGMRFGLVSEELTKRRAGKEPGENGVSTEKLTEAYNMILAESTRRLQADG